MYYKKNLCSAAKSSVIWAEPHSRSLAKIVGQNWPFGWLLRLREISLFVKWSQYISIQNFLHKQFEKACMCVLQDELKLKT